MTDYLDSLDFNNYFWPLLPVVLKNGLGENKCWLNSVLQGLKGSPSFRNFVFAKIRGRSFPGDEINPEIWKDPMTIAFWDSFLCNDLRDGKREFIKKPRELTLFRPGQRKGYNLLSGYEKTTGL